MCSINGVYLTRDINDEERYRLELLFKAVLRNSTKRGVDGFGFVSYDSFKVEDGHFATKEAIPVGSSRIEKEKYLHRLIDKNISLDYLSRIIICNFRAEPTTECLDKVSKADIQPYNYKTVWAVHNGTICNDKQLLKGVEVPTSIDSYAIPYCAYHNRMNELDGAIATALFNTDDKQLSLHLYKNFAPIELYYIYDFDCYIFTSLSEFIEPELKNYKYNHITFNPFTHIVLTAEGHTTEPFYGVEEESYKESQSKAIVICSGGLDSTVSATLACQDSQYKEITLAHFLYGCRAEKKEVECVKNITKYLQDKFPTKTIKCEFMDLSFIKNLGGSTIVDGNDSDIGKPVEGSEKDIDWVPARNTAFIGLIASYCDRYNIGNIYLGLNLEEAGAYRDNQTVFMHKFNEVLALGCHSKPVIRSSLENLVKHEIVKLGMEIGAPLHLTWSCYRDHDKPCGNCGPCQLRQTAFHINHLKEVQEYEHYFFEDVK